MYTLFIMETMTIDSVLLNYSLCPQNRGAAHRLAAYRVWQSLSCHTLTLDYRGYGDSVMAAQLGESTVVEDAKTAIKLVRDTVGDMPKVGSIRYLDSHHVDMYLLVSTRS